MDDWGRYALQCMQTRCMLPYSTHIVAHVLTRESAQQQLLDFTSDHNHQGNYQHLNHLHI